MKKLLSIAALLIIQLQLHAQNHKWTKRIGDYVPDIGYALTVDAAGNSYTTGYFYDVVDFDPGAATFNLTAAGGTDIFVCKLDANGSFVWAKQLGGTDFDEGYGIAVDAAGNVYVTGFFKGTADFDPGTGALPLTSAGVEDIFVVKLNAFGNFIWAKGMGGSSADIAYAIAVDADGNVLTTGNFTGTADFNPGVATENLSDSGGDDAFVSKLNASGDFVWAKQFGGAFTCNGRGIRSDAGNNVYITGNFTVLADFDSGPGVSDLNGGLDAYVVKLTSAGNLSWVKQLGGNTSSQTTASALVIDASGNIITTGAFSETIDLNPGTAVNTVTSGGGLDVYISKLDASGNFIWGTSFSGSGDDKGNAVNVDAAGNVYTTGYFSASVDFDPGAGLINLSAQGTEDIFVAKLGSTGNFAWAVSMGGTGSDVGRGLGTDAAGNVYSTGNFTNTVDFDPGAGLLEYTTAGFSDLYVQKLCNASAGSMSVTSCGSYTVPSGSATYTTSGTYTDVINNFSGCDSTITINLVVDNLDLSTTVTGNVIMANLSGSTYQWIDCTANTPISGATAQSYTATQSGNYAVIIDNDNCTDTSACVNVTFTGLQHFHKTKFSVYPNPANGTFSLELQGLSEVTIQNALGELVFSKQLGSGKHTIDLEQGSAGIYIIKVQDFNSLYTEKLLVK